MKDDFSNAIASLKHLAEEYAIQITIVDKSIFKSDWFLIEISIENNSFRVQVDDEYTDLRKEIPALSLCVVLRSLEEYKEATDFLDWCKKTGIESNNNALEYFRTLATILVDIEKIIDPIDSYISAVEFTLNAGAAQELRSS
jgi:hypothetical protein